MVRSTRRQVQRLQRPPMLRHAADGAGKHRPAVDHAAMKALAVSPGVAAALAEDGPVVALESTIMTHGMPWPVNLETARNVEADVRAAGATPATVAVIEGRLCIGLSDAELEHLARAQDVAKLSRADLAICMSQGGTGATTVAATMIAAALAGIEVFATGGIGGVHPGAGESFDISADLQQLAQSPVTVICAGPKAILDLPATLEVLESLGVPVIAYGQASLPAFWSATSDLAAPLRMDKPADIAAAHLMRKRLGLPGGQLVANPVPRGDEIPFSRLAPLLDQAQAEADAQGISGKSLTPFLLARLTVLSGEATLRANISLIRNNARLAAKVAHALAEARAL